MMARLSRLAVALALVVTAVIVVVVLSVLFRRRDRAPAAREQDTAPRRAQPARRDSRSPVGYGGPRSVRAAQRPALEARS